MVFFSEQDIVFSGVFVDVKSCFKIITVDLQYLWELGPVKIFPTVE